MSALPWPDHLLSLDEWAALPEDNSRHYELVKGHLQVNARPIPDHQWALKSLNRQLDDQLPAELVCYPEVDLVTGTRPHVTVRTPDLIVVTSKTADSGPSRFQAADALLVVEIAAADSWTRDHVEKLQEYAEAGIPNYWVLDLDAPITLFTYRLIDGDYEIVGRGADVLELTKPAPVTIDVLALPRRRDAGELGPWPRGGRADRGQDRDAGVVGVGSRDEAGRVPGGRDSRVLAVRPGRTTHGDRVSADRR